MKAYVYYLLILLACHLSSLEGTAHQQPGTSREKIYLQLDRPFYQQGDIIRFHLIALDADTHLPSQISDVVYVSLIDPKGSEIKKLTLPIMDGTSNGDFDLPDRGGLYTLKAYTRWSSNFDDVYLVERKIPVQNVITTRLLIKPDFSQENYGPGDRVSFELEIKDVKNEVAAGAVIDYRINLAGKVFEKGNLEADPSGEAILSFHLPKDLESTDALITAKVSYEGVEESIARSVPIVLNQVDLKFYPEGGHPVIGEISMIAFEGVNEFGKGADIRGVVLDEADQLVTTFETFHQGMGAFRINYEAGKKYRARIVSPEIDKEFRLPAPDQNPVLVVLRQTAEKLVLKVVGASGEYSLKGFSKRKLVHEERISGKEEISIENVLLPVGIIRFVLYTKDEYPLSERLVFLNKAQNMHLRITADKEYYLPGDQVKLKVKTTNEDGEPAPMKFGLSVVDDQLISFADDKSDHILSYFHLSSELKGLVEEPVFYFDEEEEKAERALDLLLLTRGWSNYIWKYLLDTKAGLLPEKSRWVSGTLTDKKGVPVQGEVYALERSGDKRMIKVKTTDRGRFIIKDFDPSLELCLFTRKPNKLDLNDRGTSDGTYVPGKYSWSLEDEVQITAPFTNEASRVEVTMTDQESMDRFLDLSLEGSVSNLEEVIVVGLGSETRKSLTGSVVSISSKSMDNFSSLNALNGKVSGVTISKNSGDPVVASDLSFSYARSFSTGNGSPLVVVDGFALTPSISRHFLTTAIFQPHEISSITYMDPPEAGRQYGSKASNGVIFLNSMSRISHNAYSYEVKEGKFNGVVLRPREFSIVRDVYQLPKPAKTERGNRELLDHLVYWNPEVVTDEKGKAELSFYTNDQVSNFRVVAEGISTDGEIGRGESTYYTSRPLSMDVKLPDRIGYEDEILADLIISNETSKDLLAVLDVQGEELEVSYNKQVEIPARTKVNVPVKIGSLSKAGDHSISFSLQSGRFSDRLERSFEVFPIGFPTMLGHSGANPNGRFSFQVTHVESGSLRTSLEVYPNVVSDLESSAAALFREPHGCFEQVSSTTYPSILALRYLHSTQSGSSASKSQALRHIRSGYQKLTAYEVKGGGFEWFGHQPAHEGLTAFGLIEFRQMKEIFDGVDDAMIQRTIDWLLSRKDGQGGFKQNTGKYGFSSASEKVNNAYIVYSLSEAGVRDIEQEYKEALEEAMGSNDHYRLALLCNSAFNLGDIQVYDQLVASFKEVIKTAGFQSIKADHSMVRSYGANLKVEVASLWALALLKDKAADLTFIKTIIEFLLKNRSGSHFGSTQATALALQVVTEFNLRTSVALPPGQVEVWLNGSKKEELNFLASSTASLQEVDLSSHIHTTGENVLELKYPHKEVNLPYNLTVGWSNKMPPSNEEVLLRLHAGLQDSSVKLNETVRLAVEIVNPNGYGLPMSIARIGIPGGLSLMPWQLKEWQEKRVFDFYEIIEGDLVLYFKELGPSQTIEIPLDLKAEVQGSFQGRACSAYLYYNDEEKYWMPGLHVEVGK